jgi:hypothetical protein
MGGTTLTDRVHAALDRLADCLGAVGAWGRLPYQRAALAVMGDEGAEKWHREFWRCVYDLCRALDAEESGQPADAESVTAQGK